MSDRAKVKRGKGYATDENAGDLLAGILDETDNAVAQEAARLEQQLEQKKREEEARKAQMEQQRRADIENKLLAEKARQEELKERRTMKMEALKPVDPASLVGGDDEAPTVAMEPNADIQRLQQEALLAAQQQAMHARTPEAGGQGQQQAVPQAAPPAEKKLPALAIVGVLAVVLLLAVGAVGFIASQNAYEADENAYAKFELAPKDSADPVTDGRVAFVPKPVVAAPVAKEDKKGPRSKKRKRRKRRRSSGSVAGKKEKEKKKKKGRKLILGNTNPWGGT